MFSGISRRETDSRPTDRPRTTRSRALMRMRTTATIENDDLTDDGRATLCATRSPDDRRVASGRRGESRPTKCAQVRDVSPSRTSVLPSTVSHPPGVTSRFAAPRRDAPLCTVRCFNDAFQRFPPFPLTDSETTASMLALVIFFNFHAKLLQLEFLRHLISSLFSSSRFSTKCTDAFPPHLLEVAKGEGSRRRSLMRSAVHREPRSRSMAHAFLDRSTSRADGARYYDQRRPREASSSSSSFFCFSSGRRRRASFLLFLF